MNWRDRHVAGASAGKGERSGGGPAFESGRQVERI
jgi:hypothetical protein